MALGAFRLAEKSQPFDLPFGHFGTTQTRHALPPEPARTGVSRRCSRSRLRHLRLLGGHPEDVYGQGGLRLAREVASDLNSDLSPGVPNWDSRTRVPQPLLVAAVRWMDAVPRATLESIEAIRRREGGGVEDVLAGTRRSSWEGVTVCGWEMLGVDGSLDALDLGIGGWPGWLIISMLTSSTSLDGFQDVEQGVDRSWLYSPCRPHREERNHISDLPHPAGTGQERVPSLKYPFARTFPFVTLKQDLGPRDLFATGISTATEASQRAVVQLFPHQTTTSSTSRTTPPTKPVVSAICSLISERNHFKETSVGHHVPWPLERSKMDISLT